MATNDFILSDMLHVRKSALTAKEVDDIRSKLVVYPSTPVNLGFGDPLPVIMYKEDTQWFSMPRKFGLTYFNRRLSSFNFQDKRACPDKIQLEFKGQLRPNQLEVKDRIINALITNPWGGCVLQADPAFGKTVLAIYIITELKAKTLIVVNTEFLITQWRERLKQFSNIKNEEIGIIQSDSMEYGKNIKVAIAMIHSLAKREYPEELFKVFQCAVVDETHRVSAPLLGQAIYKIKSKYILGMSATPYKAFGLGQVVVNTFGSAIIATSDGLKPLVYAIQMPTRINESEYVSKYSGDIILGRLYTVLSENAMRNEFVLNQIIAAGTKGRKIMVLADRREHLAKLRRMFEYRTGGVYKSGYYIGGMTEAQRKQSEGADILWATVQYASEALDIPKIDTLFLLAARSNNIIQSVGRILREHPDKKPPIVVDICDYAIPILHKFSTKRLADYKKREFPVKIVNLAT